MKSRRVPVLMAALLAIVWGTWGCGDDATGPDEDTLTLEESEALLRAVLAIGLEQGEVDPTSLTVDITLPCSGGGEAAVTGSLLPSGTENSTSLSVDLTLVPRNCVVTAEGRTFTLSGAPSLRQTGSYSFSMPGDLVFVVDIDLAFFGTVAYELGGNSGICDISVRTVSHLDFGELTQSGNASGELCGNTVDVDLSGPLIPDP